VDSQFYEDEYFEGFTTDLPDSPGLAHLLETSFAGTEKDYAKYVSVLQAAGVPGGSTIYDFGASWGYGSWQLRHAGYNVYSYEIAPTRAAYAAARLGCHMLREPLGLPEPVDCFFSAHVLEHLADPSSLWRTARAALKAGGTLVLFMPNGEPARETVNPQAYHQIWGKVHPLLLSAAALQNMALSFGFRGCAYSTPFPQQLIADHEPGPLLGDELAFVASRLGDSSNE